MVLWCKQCGALMGLGPPFDDWKTDLENLCRDCATKKLNLPETIDVSDPPSDSRPPSDPPPSE